MNEWFLLFLVTDSPFHVKMTEKSPWWKAFLPKKKSGPCKDGGSSNNFGPDFDPFAQRQEKHPSAADPKAAGNQSLSHQQSNNSSNLLSDDTFDDSQLESVFNEKSCRRNMNVSRSGRFKVKQRGRSSLPIQEKETENTAPGKEDVRWHWGREGGDHRLLCKDAWEQGERFKHMKMPHSREARSLLCVCCDGDYEDDEHSSFSPVLQIMWYQTWYLDIFWWTCVRKPPHEVTLK